MIGYCPLASGSRGNAIFFGTPEVKILIDAGLSAKALEERLAGIGLSLSQMDAIFVTHEHSDHIRGLSAICKRWNIPVFANIETAKAIASLGISVPRFKIFTTNEPFAFGDLSILPFSIQHDTVDPVAFCLQLGQIKAGFCADLGFVTPSVRHHLRDCDYLYLEANHQPSMVHASNRPERTKTRILGPSGHLSNEQAAALLNEVWHPKLKYVHLAHLSEECNHPKVALDIVQSELQREKRSLAMGIAEQYRISEPIHFESAAAIS